MFIAVQLIEKIDWQRFTCLTGSIFTNIDSANGNKDKTKKKISRNPFEMVTTNMLFVIDLSWLYVHIYKKSGLNKSFADECEKHCGPMLKVNQSIEIRLQFFVKNKKKQQKQCSSCQKMRLKDDNT